MTARKRRRRRSAAPLLAVLALIAVAIGALVYIYTHYNVVMGTLFEKGEPIDVRGRSVSVRQYNEIARRHADCVVLWDIPIGEGRYDCTSEAIAVGNFSEKGRLHRPRRLGPQLEAISASQAYREAESVYVRLLFPQIPMREAEEIGSFAYFSGLKRVDATAADCYDEILALREALGEEVELKWNVVIGGESFPHTTKELTLPEGTSAEETAEKLAYLPEVRMVDTTNARYDSEALSALKERYPKIRFLYKVTIAGETFRSNTENINIPESAALDLPELISHGSDFSELKIINLGSRMMSLDDVIAIRKAFGGVEVLCRTTVCGKECSTDWTELDLSNRTIDDPAEAEKAIEAMAHLEKLYLCDCNIPYETLDEMRSRHDDCEIVWRVYLNGVGCRTDADNFCMSKYSNDWGFLPYANAEPIKYCRNMVTLDLGHGNFDRIDFVETMPHLKYLMIVGAPVTSLEPLRDSKELYYLEMFFTNVRDLEPIVGLQSLKHLNISHCRFDDYTQLFEMTQLERLWWVDSGLTEAQQQELREALPNTKMCFYAWDDNAVGGYWRDDRTGTLSDLCENPHRKQRKP